MKTSFLNLHHRIVVPFVLLFVAASAATAYLSVYLISRDLKLRLTNQLEHASDVISQADFALNAPVLERLKFIMGADVVTYRTDGTVVVSTIASSDSANLLRLIQDPEVSRKVFQEHEPSLIRNVRVGQIPYTIAYRPVSTRSDTLVAIIADTADVAATQAAITRAIALITAFVVLLMALMSRFLARNFTAPVLQLVKFTKGIEAGELDHATIQAKHELGVLVQSFNDMVLRLQQSEEKLVQSEKLAVAGILAARVAHDVRNPLTSIKMQAELLKSRRSLTGDDRAMLEAILREIERVEWVVRGLLDVANPGQLKLEPADLNALVLEVIQMTDAQMKHRKIAVEKRLNSHIPAIPLDDWRFKQALLNIVVNAAEAMPNGGIILVITELISEGANVCLRVCDDGTGIDPKIEQRLFSPFVSTKREGVGLGLVNTRSIIERHGGHVILSRRQGGGTEATIVLPVDPKTPDNHAMLQKHEHPPNLWQKS